MKYRIICITKILNKNNLCGVGAMEIKTYKVQKKGWLWGWNTLGTYHPRDKYNLAFLEYSFKTLEEAKDFINKRVVKTITTQVYP